MKYLNKFNNFNNFFNIFEATFTIDKHGIDYIPQSDKGVKSLEKLRLNPSMVFKFTESKPNPEDKVIFIRRSSFSIEVYSDVISKHTKLFHYETGDSKYPFACVPIGEKTDRLVQKEAKGRAASRGDYFRETAFLIILAQLIWKQKGKMIKVYGKNGLINFNYDITFRPTIISGESIEKFEDFHDNKEIYESAMQQSETLIDWLGDSISNIQGFYKNSTDLILNYEAEYLIKEEISFFNSVLQWAKDDKADLKAGIPEWVGPEDYMTNANSQTTYKIPKRTSLSKWNPSDIWICYKGYDRAFKNEEFWNQYNYSLEQFNDFFKESIKQKTGIIGVSLKQQVTPPHYTFPVNLKPTQVSHTLSDFEVSSDLKTVVINYNYLISGNPGSGKIDLRTFETQINSNLCIEVKGSLKSQHMSGKAGALINYLVPEKISKDIEFIKDEEDILKIMKKFMPSLSGSSRKDYKFHNSDLEYAFKEDIKHPKTQESNSRMQAVIFSNWISSLPQKSQNRIITDIIRFAKSESDWSATHLIVK